MNTAVPAPLAPVPLARVPAADPPPAPLSRSLDCAARGEWAAAHGWLGQALSDPATRQNARFLLWEVCQALGDRDAALAHLDAALRINPLTTRPATATPRRRVLALAVPGDFQANLPLGPLLDAETELHTLWLRDPAAILADPLGATAGHIPPFDCVFLAIAEDDRHAAALAAADALIRALGRPAINRAGAVAALSRTGAAALLAGLPGAVVPQPQPASPAELGCPAWRAAHGLALPLIVRPARSHAGLGLERVDDAAALDRLLARSDAALFHATPFHDYRSPDGLYRKYRVIFVDGRPMPYHLAVHDHWAVWYYNAAMDRHASRRAEEAAFLADLAGQVPAPALAALHAMPARVGLDYFGLDCAVLPDGRLLVFEVETGMLVHADERSPMFDYKRRFVPRISQAVSAMIDRRVAESRQARPGLCSTVRKREPAGG
jgi:tetratricopeptide (TPR) repeat protein